MYYFCSKEDFKNGTILQPRVPINRMNNEENQIKRICVSRCIDGCLIAIGGLNVGGIVNIYSCTFEGETYKPNINKVVDCPFTGEEWILTDTTLTKFIQLKITKVIERTIGKMSMDTYCYNLI
jgi:uncharacterized protein YjhX (UPF0386 family)